MRTILMSPVISVFQYEDTLDDYLEMFIQFGYVTLFSSAFPLAALCALLNNVVEIRSDAFKLCMTYQRPFGKTVENIGTWQVWKPHSNITHHTLLHSTHTLAPYSLLTPHLLSHSSHSPYSHSFSPTSLSHPWLFNPSLSALHSPLMPIPHILPSHTPSSHSPFSYFQSSYSLCTLFFLMRSHLTYSIITRLCLTLTLTPCAHSSHI